MSSTILHSSDEGSKIPLAKKFTYLYWAVNQERINKENGTEIVYWLEMWLCIGWKWGCVCFHEFHLILGSITMSLFLGIWFVPPQPIEKRAARADLRKTIFFTSQIVRLPIKSSRLPEQFFFPGRSVKIRPDQR